MARHKKRAISHGRFMRGHGLAGGRMADARELDDGARTPPEARAARCTGFRG